MAEQNVNIICSHSVEMIQLTIIERGRGKKMRGRINLLIT